MRRSQTAYLFSAVAQTFLSAGSGDFPVPSSNLREHRGTRKFREPAGWKSCATGRGYAKQVRSLPYLPCHTSLHALTGDPLWTREQLTRWRKGDKRKARIALRLRREAILTLKRMAEQLAMGTWATVAHRLYEAKP